MLLRKINKKKETKSLHLILDGDIFDWLKRYAKDHRVSMSYVIEVLVLKELEGESNDRD